MQAHNDSLQKQSIDGKLQEIKGEDLDVDEYDMEEVKQAAEALNQYNVAG